MRRSVSIGLLVVGAAIVAAAAKDEISSRSDAQPAGETSKRSLVNTDPGTKMSHSWDSGPHSHLVATGTQAFVTNACEAAFQDIRAKDEQLRAKDEQIHALEVEVLRLTRSPWARTITPLPMAQEMLAPRGPQDASVGDANILADTAQVPAPSKKLKEMEQQCIDSAKGVALQEENELLQAGNNKGAAAAEKLTEKKKQTERDTAKQRPPAGKVEKWMDWTQCVSEGGKKDCARCRSSENNGMLPCDLAETLARQEVPSGRKSKGQKEEETQLEEGCRDEDIAQNLNFFLFETAPCVNGFCREPKAVCREFNNRLVLDGSAVVTYGFPGLNATIPTERKPGSRLESARKAGQQTFPAHYNNAVITKARVVRPHLTTSNIGMIIFKRLVMHTCTGKTPACKKGTKVVDVMKESFCVKCPQKKYNRAGCGEKCDVFKKRHANFVTEEMKQAFVKECLPDAFDADGIKAEYRCGKGGPVAREDLQQATAAALAF